MGIRCDGSVGDWNVLFVARARFIGGGGTRKKKKINEKKRSKILRFQKPK